MEEQYKDVWELYGLYGDPFFTEPLSLFSGVDIRVGFVGREEEVRRLQTILGSTGSTRVLVTGDVGVGKTTFANYVRANAPSKKFFTPLKEIQTQPEWTGADFILNTLSAIYHTIKTRSDLDPSQVSAEVWMKLEMLVDIVEHRDRNFSIELLGVGGGIGAATSLNVPTPTMHSLQTLFETLATEIQNMGYREIILSYNNLEIIEQKDLIRLFNSIRDFIQVENTKFVFIGGLTVPSTLSTVPRVHSIMTETPIVLPNLSLREVKELLEKRIKCLTVPGLVATKPYEDDAISKLYSLHNGNLRNTLNSLSTAIRAIVKDTPIVISGDDIRRILPEVAKKRWLNRLTATEHEVLMHILREGETNNKKIAADLKKLKQNISPITKKLTELCAIRCRIDGKEKFFSVEHSVKWLLFEDDTRGAGRLTPDKISNEIQKVLSQ